jgi:signal transduction histidine kinase/ketosteroid isomerase-like protein
MRTAGQRADTGFVVGALSLLVERWLSAYSASTLDDWAELLHEDVVVVAETGTVAGREAARAYAAGTLHAFPGLRPELLRVVAETEHTVVAEYRLVNTEPERYEWRLAGTVCDVCTVRDGRIATLRSYYLPDAADRTEVAPLPSRLESGVIADERAALHRVARLVAQGVSEAELFAAVTEESARLVGADATALLRFETDDTVTLVAAWSAADAAFPLGAREPVDPRLRSVRETGRPVRFGPAELPRMGPFVAEARRLGIRTSVGVPITVDGRVWGVSFVAAAAAEPFPDATETRMAGFTDLVATAIANAQARSELQALLEQQRALRRVAMYVARGAPASELLTEVAVQACRVLGVESVALLRLEGDGYGTMIAGHGYPAVPEAREPIRQDGLAAAILRTGRPARIDDFSLLDTPVATVARRIGARAAVGAPIVTNGELWGVIYALSSRAPIPSGTEHALGQFGELVATAIANAEAHEELTSSRARVVAAADESRRRIQRDLHDGAQQRLVHSIITLRLADTALRGDDGPARELVRQALTHVERATGELRDLVQGIMPAALLRGGLRAGVASLLDHVDLPVELDVPDARLSPAAETTAYFVVAEALTNAVKHSGASSASVSARVAGGELRLEFRDDGRGGADPAKGSGLLGLVDRVAAGGGTIAVTSPPGDGTVLAVRLPSGVQAAPREPLATAG